MNCIEKDLIQKYIDGEINSNEKIRIENHLLECPFCSDVLEKQQKLSNKMKSLFVNLDNEEVVRPPLPKLINGTIPVIETPLPNKVLSWNKTIIYGVWSACAILFFLLYPLRNFLDKPDNVIHMQTIIKEVDANLPYSEQETVISITDKDGNVSYIQ